MWNRISAFVARLLEQRPELAERLPPGCPCRKDSTASATCGETPWARARPPAGRRRSRPPGRRSAARTASASQAAGPSGWSLHGLPQLGDRARPEGMRRQVGRIARQLPVVAARCRRGCRRSRTDRARFACAASAGSPPRGRRAQSSASPRLTATTGRRARAAPAARRASPAGSLAVAGDRAGRPRCGRRRPAGAAPPRQGGELVVGRVDGRARQVEHQRRRARRAAWPARPPRRRRRRSAATTAAATPHPPRSARPPTIASTPAAGSREYARWGASFGEVPGSEFGSILEAILRHQGDARRGARCGQQIAV